MSATIEYIDDLKEANFLLNRCLNTIDDLKNKVDEEKNRVQKYRETNKKLRSKHIELRDYFAAKAMPALIKAETDACKHFGDDRGWEWFDIDLNESSLQDLAKRSYDIAEAMMEARKK